MARVLVIDDDPLFVKLMVHALERRGHDVAFAHDGEVGRLAQREVPHDEDLRALDDLFALYCDALRQRGLAA